MLIPALVVLCQSVMVLVLALELAFVLDLCVSFSADGAAVSVSDAMVIGASLLKFMLK